MRLNSTSFKGSYSNYDYNFSKRNTKRNNDTSYKDEFVRAEIIKPRYPKKEEGNKKRLIAIPLATATLGTTMALLLTFGSPTAAEEPLKVSFNPEKMSIVSIAEENNCDLDFLLSYNNIEEDADLHSISEIIIPSSFDYLENRIEETQEALNSTKLSDKKREELENYLNAITAKQYEQNQVAQMYSDGEYIFITININESNEDEKYKYGINVETLKKLFDIKDGAIRENNELEVRWESYENGEGSYMDYTYNWFHTGDIIKVPVSAIQTKDINLSNYLED